MPIVDLARVFALSTGLDQVDTVERLQAAAGTPALSQEAAVNLEDALALIATLRARHQSGQIKLGEAPDNYIHPETLSPLERNHLKDAFEVIATMQKVLSQRFQVGRLV
jgi:CBS domain-containing protein